MSGPGATEFVLENGAGRRVAVRGERIVGTPGRRAPTVPVGSGVFRPGLINAHDHLTFNHYPRLGEPPYGNMYEWAEDVQARFAEGTRPHRQLPEREALLFGALKNLLGGVTRVIHHDRWSRHLEGEFPVRVTRVRVLHSLGLEEDLPAAADRARSSGDGPLCMHLAEGVDGRAAGEVRRAAEMGLLGPDFLAVHLVGVDEEGIELLREAGCALVWCPSSNLHLYGETAPRLLLRSGIDVLLGTDALVSADGTLLEELQVAAGMERLDDRALEAAVCETPARRLGLPDPRLEAGRPADVLLLRRPLLEARPADVALVLVAGRPRYGDADLAALFDLAGVETEPLAVGGEEKLVARPLGKLARRIAELSPDCRRIFR